MCTQDTCADRATVHYVSTHHYPLYPGTGHWRETGVGTTLNIALPPGSGDDVYAAALQRVVEPAYRKFEPDFTLISLGLDDFHRARLSNVVMRLSLTCYSAFIRAVVDLRAGPTVLAVDSRYSRAS